MTEGSAAFHGLRARHVADIRAFTAEAVARLAWSREHVLEEQTRRLRALVAHAQRSSPFHAERLGHIEASRLDLADLPKIPVLTKAEVMEHWDRLVTDPVLRLEDVTAHLHRLHTGAADNPYYLDRYYAAATGGTSGKRGVFLWDWETFVTIANVTYRMEAADDLAHPPAGPRRTAVVCAGSYVHGSRFVFPITLDPARETRVFPADTPIATMVEQLNAYQPDRVVGYASIVQELCAQALDGRLRITPNRLSTNSEELLPEARRMAREAWGIDVHNSWGSVEIGLGAVEGNAFGGLTLNEDFLIFEPVDAEDRPVEDATKADRVLVTKLFGSVMPIIRCEMTDTMVFDDGPNPDAPGYRRIREIKGRADAWFVYPGGVKVHPMVFRGVLGQDPHLSEYQVRQTAEGCEVLAIGHGAFDPAAVAAGLRRALAAAGLPGAVVSVRTVGELPRHAETSKLKRFVPLEP